MLCLPASLVKMYDISMMVHTGNKCCIGPAVNQLSAELSILFLCPQAEPCQQMLPRLLILWEFKSISPDGIQPSAAKPSACNNACSHLLLHL